ncbi:hypothetical protein LARV_00078 [Longilinea arvoryzae]|uniref:DoxX-like family n=1 Tax=Longilinea arvoryzae TaxID=360412 RepID=A0A0S7BBB2_9CHLR|nr:hypothetical protein [Longilinea arvoryzae]GAP12345.1 hypothetical protein LARV_00078 [Longilinea arvoryzae]
MSSRLEDFGRWVSNALTIAFWAGLVLLGGLRLWQSLTLEPWLVEVGVKPGPLYLTLTGTAQALAAGLALVAYLSRRPGSKWLVRALAGLWLLGFWIDRIWIAVSPAAQINNLFVAVFLALWLLIIWAATSQQN